MSKGERAAMARAIARAEHLKEPSDRLVIFDSLTSLGEARGRFVRKKASDARTDSVWRKLVGARVPVQFADECRRCAGEQGLSLYAFVVGALEEAVRDG